MSSQHWPSAHDAGTKVANLLDIQDSQKSSTIFVRNLAFDVDDKLLAAFFDSGPVKRAFVVKDKNTDASRGMGFVEFAFALDAEAAVSKYHNKLWMGRPLKVELALQQSSDPIQRQKVKQSHLDEQKVKAIAQHKEKSKEKSKEKTEEDKLKDLQIAQQYKKLVVKEQKPFDKKAPPANDAPKEDDSLGCILLITGLDKLVERDELLNKVKKFGEVVQLVIPAPESTPATKTKSESIAARMTFKDYLQAKAAMNSLQGRSFGPNRVSPTIKLLSSLATIKASRLIVRNLPFTANDAELTKLFGDCGIVNDVHFPRSATGQARGFAFVQMETFDGAQAAITRLNGFKMGTRPIAVDFTVPKAQFDKQAQIIQENQQLQREMETARAALESSDDESEDKDYEKYKNSKGKKDPNSLVKLEDDAKSDQHFVKELGLDSGMNDEDNDEDDESELVYQATGDSDDDQGDDDEDAEDEDDEDDYELDEDGNRKVEKEEDAKQSKVSDVSQERTIFIRNLSYDTTEDAIYNKFQQFGRLIMVKICRDHVLNRSLGTAFIKFDERQVVLDLLENYAGEKLEKKEANRRKHSYSSLLNSSSIRLDGRDLILSLAVERKEATRLRTEGQLKVKDKRNLYLAKEGVILPDTPSAAGVSTSDMEKRSRGWQEKKQKLRNPNFAVSTTRLAVRNLPAALTDKELRTLVLGLVRKQLKEEGKKIGGVALKQVRIERDAKKLDKDGLPKSRGFGFVEFRDHDHSLLCLRYMNNNPTVWTPKTRPIVEFALEDARKLLIHRKRYERQALKSMKADSAKSDAEGAAMALLTGGKHEAREKKPETAGPKGKEFDSKRIVDMFKTKGKSEEKEKPKRGRPQRQGNDNNDARKNVKKQRY